MSLAVIAIQVVSTGYQIYANEKAADAAEDAADYNAKIAENEADRIELENHETIKRKRKEKRHAMAQAKARLAANGAALGEGSSMDFMEVMDSRLETQIQDSSRQAQLQARAARQKANASRWSGGQQADALRLQNYGTLLEGASNTVGTYRTYKSNTKPSQDTLI